MPENPIQELEERFAYLKYVGHIAVMTGKLREAVSLEGVKTISHLLFKLDKTYPGLREVFLPPGGVFNSRTAIILRRPGQCSFSIVNEEEPIRDGDLLTLW